MADDALIDTAEGQLKVSADEVTASSPKRIVQRMKLAYSADGVETHVPADGDGLLVNSSILASQATAAAILSAAQSIKTAVEILDNAIAGSEMQVDVVSGAFTVSGSVAMGVPTGSTKTQKQLRLTASTTSTDLWSPASGKRIAVKSLLITWQGALACRLTIWAAQTADVTFSDTEDILFDITLDADENGGVHIVFPDGYPWETDTANDELHVTLSANKVVFIQAIGDERT